MAKNDKKNVSAATPYVLVVVYLIGLFLLAQGREILGFILIAASVAYGIFVLVNMKRKKYKPSRRPKTRVDRLLQALADWGIKLNIRLPQN